MNLNSSRLRMYRLQFVIAILLFASGVLLLLFKEVISEIYNIRYTYILLSSMACFVYGIAIILLLYLRGTISFKALDNIIVLREGEEATIDSGERANQVPKEILAQMSQLASEVESLKSAQIGTMDGNFADLVAALEPTVVSGVANTLENRFSKSSRDVASLIEIRSIFSSARQRLQIELNSLTRRSNVNLVIGAITTVMAISLLGYMVLLNPTKFETFIDILSHYVPRVTLVIFIEVFSFFFLRLYRATLSEIHIYQNDLTLLAVQHVAVETAWAAPDPAARAALSKELLSQRGRCTSQNKDSSHNAFDPDALAKLLVQFSKVVLKSEKGKKKDDDD